MEQDQLSQARGLSSAEVSDALDYFGVPGSAVGIRPVAGPRKLFGPAFTVRFGPVDTAQNLPQLLCCVIAVIRCVHYCPVC